MVRNKIRRSNRSAPYIRHAIGIATAALSLVLTLILGLAFAADPPSAPPNPPAAAKPVDEAAKAKETEAEIAKLVTALGDEDFEVRDDAQKRLSKLGAAAFDALAAAEEHPDGEIALRSRFLLRSIRIPWVRDDDPVEVRQMLRNYDALDTSERRQRIDRFASTPPEVAAAPLCRIVRYEKMLPLAKYAALAVIDRAPADGEPLKRQLNAIATTLAGSTRPPAQWLSAYAKFFSQPDEALAEWQKLVAAETAAVQANSSDANADFLIRLQRRQYVMLHARGRRDEALAVVRQMIALQPAKPEELTKLLQWLTAQKAWDAIDEVARKNELLFSKEPMLLYALAQAKLAAGEKEAAENAAERAFKARGDNADSRLAIAFQLSDLGLIDWAEREYRSIIERGPPESGAAVQAGLLLAAMFQEQERYLDAAKARESIIKLIDSKPALRELLESADRDYLSPARIRATMDYCYAMHHKAAGDARRQIEHLDRAIKSDPADADVLIELFRLPEQDAARRAATKSLIEKATRKFEIEIKELEDLAVPAETDGELATQYNNYAWLVANTFGDFDKALQLSLKSTEMRPNSGGLLDTLSHCYYAKGDLDKAVATQTRALELEPRSKSIARQLEAFKAEAAGRKAAPTKAGAPNQAPRASEPD